ncbi:ribosomal protein S24e [Mycena amicta]|nr:ribosomal protein S24e [Mycena amicta]
MAKLSEKLAALYKTDQPRVVTFGFRTNFGGGTSNGFTLIYDEEGSQKKIEPEYLRRVRVGFTPDVSQAAEGV